MKEQKRKDLNVPRLTEQEAEAIKQGLMDEAAEVRADTFVTVFGKVLPVVPTSIERTIKDAAGWQQTVATSFELVGGLPRLAMWADENYGDFIKQVGHTFTATQQTNMNVSGNVTVVSHVPDSPLNEPAPIRAIDARESEDLDDLDD